MFDARLDHGGVAGTEADVAWGRALEVGVADSAGLDEQPAHTVVRCDSARGSGREAKSNKGVRRASTSPVGNVGSFIGVHPGCVVVASTNLATAPRKSGPLRREQGRARALHQRQRAAVLLLVATARSRLFRVRV